MREFICEMPGTWTSVHRYQPLFPFPSAQSRNKFDDTSLTSSADGRAPFPRMPRWTEPTA